MTNLAFVQNNESVVVDDSPQTVSNYPAHEPVSSIMGQGTYLSAADYL